MKRGWCPGARRPMETGDGLLLRLHPGCGRLTAAQADAVAAVAERCGAGLLDVTGRGNLQIRGVRPDTLAAAQDGLDAVGLLELDRPGPIRPVILSPLAGLDPAERFDVPALAAVLEAALTGVEGLPEKLSVSVDGGGALPLAEVGADISVGATETGRIEAAARRGPRRTHAAFSSLEDVEGERSAAALAEALARVQKLLSQRAELFASVGEGREQGTPEVRAACPRSPTSLGAAGERAAAAGSFATREGAAVLAACAYGQLSADAFRAAASLARSHGDGLLRLSFTRGLLLAGLAPAAAATVQTGLGAAGFVIDAADPRLGIRACTGAPGCASALASVRADADRLAHAAPAYFARGGSLHLSGCRKGCASRAPAGLTLVARGGGLYDAVMNGTPRDPATRTVAISAVGDILAGLRADAA